MTENLFYTGFQLNIGNFVPQFSRFAIDIPGELKACQRYYHQTWPIDSAPSNVGRLLGIARNNGDYFVDASYPVEMRAIPTFFFPPGINPTSISANIPGTRRSGFAGGGLPNFTSLGISYSADAEL